MSNSKLVNYTKTLFIPDIHAPFQDEIALNALKEFIKWFKPDDIIFLGDLIDFYAISHFVKDPERITKLQEELDQAQEVMADILKTSKYKTNNYFVRGNHEARLQKYLWTQAKEISSLRSLQLERLMDFKKLGVKYIAEGKFNYKGIIVKHGNIVRKFSGYTAKAEFEKTGISGISGHTHRLNIYRQSNEAGNFTWIEAGCLSSLKQEYLDNEIPNWSLGFAIGYFNKHNSKINYLETVPIIKGKAIYGGMEIY